MTMLLILNELGLIVIEQTGHSDGAQQIIANSDDVECLVAFLQRARQMSEELRCGVNSASDPSSCSPTSQGPGHPPSVDPATK